MNVNIHCERSLVSVNRAGHLALEVAPVDVHFNVVVGFLDANGPGNGSWKEIGMISDVNLSSLSKLNTIFKYSKTVSGQYFHVVG